jgi:hypothetical protein
MLIYLDLSRTASPLSFDCLASRVVIDHLRFNGIAKWTIKSLSSLHPSRKTTARCQLFKFPDRSRALARKKRLLEPKVGY